MQKKRSAALIVPLVLLVSIISCDAVGVGSTNERSMSLSFSVPRAVLTTAHAALVPITDGTHNIDLQNVDLTIDRIAIERTDDPLDNDAVDTDADTDTDTDTDTDNVGDRHHDGETIRLGGTTVALPLTGGVITPITVPLPNGSFDEIELRVSAVRARGTFDGQAFDITVRVNAELELDIDPVFVVDSEDDRLNLTITIDPTTWFKTEGMALIDPRQVQLNDALRSTLEHRIRASFRAIEDDDHDAEHDRSGHDGDRSGSNSGRR
jgi:hypothetical protein